MSLPASVIAELRCHIPAVDCNMRLSACSCGWKLRESTDDIWISFLDHLATAAPKLVLRDNDLNFLKAMHIKV